MNITVNFSSAYNIIMQAINNNEVPMLWGSPGIGKSALIELIAEHCNLLLIDLRLGQCDPTDLLGFPHIDTSRNKAGYVPMDTFPLDDEPLPSRWVDQKMVPYDGWILFLDEFLQAPPAVQNASFKLVLDRKIGQQALHPNCAIIAASNFISDRAGSEQMGTAMQSRFAPHLNMSVDVPQWIEYAAINGIDQRIVSFLEYQPQRLHDFDPDHSDHTFACPRTWTKAAKFINNVEPLTDDSLPILAGTIGEGTAREFIGFCEIYASLTTVAEILQNPESAPIPDEPEVLYAMSGSLAGNATKTNIAKLLPYIARLPAEFRTITMRSIIRQDRSYLEMDVVDQWIDRNVHDLFG